MIINSGNAGSSFASSSAKGPNNVVCLDLSTRYGTIHESAMASRQSIIFHSIPRLIVIQNGILIVLRCSPLIF